ncbi:MAG TPA: hypothetical protein VHG72_13910 [Polyangia bacterium]|nr:hypothetical protein [Polyangia bacterium]
MTTHDEIERIRAEARSDTGMEDTVRRLRKLVTRLRALVTEAESWRDDGDRASFWDVMNDIEREAAAANPWRSKDIPLTHGEAREWLRSAEAFGADRAASELLSLIRAARIAPESAPAAMGSVPKKRTSR